jgi:hypothetical protein
MTKKNQDKEPNCDNCKFIKIKPIALIENYPILSIVERYSSLLIDGNGGISAQGIQMALDSEKWINEFDRPLYIRKLVLYLTTAIETARKNKG